MAKIASKPRARKSLADIEPPPRTKRPESLTSREQEILELIWAGFKNKEIGHRLKISVKTVEAAAESLLSGAEHDDRPVAEPDLLLAVRGPRVQHVRLDPLA